ncbi:MAG: hypothetical protein U0163_14300 [Gemmatimonadaceae bacterium]
MRLYLAGRVTSMRTGGNMNGFGEINIKQAIERGQKAGPWIDATAPYLQGAAGSFGQMKGLTGPDDARDLVNYWANHARRQLRAYMHISRAELKAAIDAAHKRGLKVTGHLCSVTYREAAELGIDDLEHGFLAATDFVRDKKPDECPGQGKGQASLSQVDPASPEVKDLIAFLVKRHVAMTSTLTVFETFTPGRCPPRVERADAAAQGAVRKVLRHDLQGLAVHLQHTAAQGHGAGARSCRPADCSLPAPIPRAQAG